MRTIEDVLEEIKQQGNYAVSLRYGGEMGLDDFGDAKEERKIEIVASPAGYLGGVRYLWKGTLTEIKEMDLNQTPIAISNPPLHKEYEKTGRYVWGSEEYVAKLAR